MSDQTPHAPADDEREAQRIVEDAKEAYLSAYPGDDHRERFATLDRLAAAFRRSEVPEPSAEPTCEHGSPLSALCDYAARYASGETDDAEPRHAEPQGEPSDAQVEAAMNAYRDFSGNYIDRSSRGWHRDRMRAALRAAGGVR